MNRFVKCLIISILSAIWGYASDSRSLNAAASDLRVYAHSLYSSLNDETGEYTFTFSTNVQSISGRLVFYHDSLHIFTDEIIENNTVLGYKKDTVVWRHEAGYYPIEGPIQPGTHSIKLTKYELPIITNNRAYQNMSWSVELKNTTRTEIRKVFEDNNFRCPQGIAIDNNPESEFFGRIYVANAPNSISGTSANVYDAGIVIYEPDMNDDTPFRKLGAGAKSYIPDGWRFPTTSEVALINQRWFMHRIAVNPANNHVYFAKSTTNSLSDGINGTAVFQMQPHAETEGVLTGTVSDNVVAGVSEITNANSITFDTKGNLYIINGANLVDGGATGKLYKLTQTDDDIAYDKAVQFFTPEDTLRNAEGRSDNNLSHWAYPDNDLLVHGRGGIWTTQYNTEASPSSINIYPVLGHIHVGNYGNSDVPEEEFQLDIAKRPRREQNGVQYAPWWWAQILFGDHEIEDATPHYTAAEDDHVEAKGIGGVIAYHEKGGRYSTSAFLAVGSDNTGTVHVFAIKYQDVFPEWRNEWYGFGIDYLCDIPINGGEFAYIDALAFDYAGNLYVASETTHSLYVYSFANYDAYDPSQHLDPTAYVWEAGYKRLASGSNILNRDEPLDDNYTAVPAALRLKASGVVVFNDTTGNKQWFTNQNWSIQRFPMRDEAVLIRKNKTAEIAEGEGLAYSIEMEPGSKLHIKPTGGLTIGENGLYKKDSTCFEANEADRIVIESTPDGAGFLRISPDFQPACEPYVTVNYTSTAIPPSGQQTNRDAIWQYVGAPADGVTHDIDANTWFYHWSEAQGWVELNGSIPLEPFDGYTITQRYPDVVRSWTGKLIRRDHTVNFTYTNGSNSMKGDNLFVNSYLAPINLTTFTEDDWEDPDDLINKTFYLFNSGSWNQWQGALNNQYADTTGVRDSSPGHYYAIPALGAKFLHVDDQIVVPSMQGIYIARKEGNSITQTQLQLDYRKHIWNFGGDYDDLTLIREKDMNRPMRAPAYHHALRRLRIHATGATSGGDRMYIIEHPDCSREYDNGYDSPNILAENQLNIYTSENFGEMEVSFANDIDSMYIGLTTGADTLYTLYFSALQGATLYLRDLACDTVLPLSEGMKYSFTAQPNSTNAHRFQVLLHYSPEDSNGNNTPTLLPTTSADFSCWYTNNTLCYANAQIGELLCLYDIHGHIVQTHALEQSSGSMNLSYLTQGAYIVAACGQIYKLIK